MAQRFNGVAYGVAEVDQFAGAALFDVVLDDQ